MGECCRWWLEWPFDKGGWLLFLFFFRVSAFVMSEEKYTELGRRPRARLLCSAWILLGRSDKVLNFIPFTMLYIHTWVLGEGAARGWGRGGRTIITVMVFKM